MARASMKELHAFANRVREAGGGNPIDALMPAVPKDSTQCLIAKNLNFNCVVAGWGINAQDEAKGIEWSMTVEDESTAQKIADAIDSEVREVWSVDEWDAFRDSDFDEPAGYAIPLPAEIGQIAADFDYAQTLANRGAKTDEDVRLLREMVPYFEASEQEAVGLATAINENGELII